MSQQCPDPGASKLRSWMWGFGSPRVRPYTSTGSAAAARGSSSANGNPKTPNEWTYLND